MAASDEFRQKVRQLVAEGKLSAREAEALLGEPLPEDPMVAGAPTGDAGAAGPASSSPESPSPVSLSKVEADPSTAAAPYAGQVPLKLDLHVAGYSLKVRVDETLHAPQLTASAENRLRLVGDAEGWHVSRVPVDGGERGDGWIERLLAAFLQEGQLSGELAVPAGVLAVDARVQGGNLRLGDASELQAKVQGGNLNWNARLEGGRHDVKVQGGNATVKLRPGSSVRLAGDVTAGHLTATGFALTKKTHDYVNASYEGVLADGRASLNLKVQGGNARVATEDAPEVAS